MNIDRNALTCPECERAKLQQKVARLSGKTHGESYAVNIEALVCPKCKFATIPKDKMGEFALRVADAYREAHDLLTSSQIKDRRADLGMSQQQFANYLGVGAASVKRWELGSIQDGAMNELMALKTDLAVAEANMMNIATRLGKPGWSFDQRSPWKYASAERTRFGVMSWEVGDAPAAQCYAASLGARRAKRETEAATTLREVSEIFGRGPTAEQVA